MTGGMSQNASGCLETRFQLSALVHKYGDVFSGRTEYHSPPFDPSRRRDNTAPPQDERIHERIYAMLHLAHVRALPAQIFA
jgi:hypothetical protein